MTRDLNLKIGYLCNNDCLFCAQADNKPLGNPSLESLIIEMTKASAYCDKIIFTGGEPTIRKDIIDLVKQAKTLGFKRLQLQSNVRNLHVYQYCCDLIEAGINEFAPSLHGHNQYVHDLHTGRPGSFNETIKALGNLKDLKQYVITNTVITSHNYKNLGDIARLLLSYKVAQVQFAYVHSVGNGRINMEAIAPRVTDVLPYLFSALHTAVDSNVKCMAEAFPLCLMGKYRKYCSEYFMPDAEIRDTHYIDPDYGTTRRTKSKVKPLKCGACLLNSSCEGAWCEYIAKFGDDELVPINDHDQ